MSEARHATEDIVDTLRRINANPGSLLVCQLASAGHLTKAAGEIERLRRRVAELEREALWEEATAIGSPRSRDDGQLSLEAMYGTE